MSNHTKESLPILERRLRRPVDDDQPVITT